MSAVAEQPDSIKVVHTYGPGLHSTDLEADVNDPRWQRDQVAEFVDFAQQAEDLGFDGVTVTEHHVPSMTCSSPHLLLAAAAMRTSRIRLGTAVTTLPLYNPVRVAEEAGLLDLLSNGRFELGLGKGKLVEAQLTIGRSLTEEEFDRLWLEDLRLLELALTEQEFTFSGEFWQVPEAHTIATRPLQNPLPIWIGGASPSTMAEAARRGWNVMRNFGSNADHRAALEGYIATGAEHGHALSGANMMVERFVALGQTPQEVGESLARFGASFGRFLKIFTTGGRSLPTTDAEFHAEPGPGGGPKRPSIAVAGTPDEVIDSLKQTLDETGARRLLVELFTTEERELFVREVLPALRAHVSAPVELVG